MKQAESRAGRFARSQAVERDRQFAAGHPALLIKLAVALGVLGGAMLVFAVYIDSPGGYFAAGLATGTLGTFAFSEVRSAAGSEKLHRAAESELAVEGQLAKHAPTGAAVRSHISFRDGDIDHAVIGDEWVVAVEVKSSQADWTFDEHGIRWPGNDPLRQVKRSLKRLQQLTAGNTHCIKGESWLVIDGPHNAERDRGLPVMVGGSWVATPATLGSLLDQLPIVADTGLAAAKVAKVDAYITTRDAYEERCSAPGLVSR